MGKQRKEQRESLRSDLDDARNMAEEEERNAYRQTYDFEPPRELPGKKGRRETW